MLWFPSRNSKGLSAGQLVLIITCLLFFPALSNAQIVITLKKDFVKQLADRVTISSHFSVAALSKVHAQKDDGDIHVAGTAPEIGLATVAELMNARTERNGAVKELMAAQGSGPVEIVGAWRIWAEHGGQTEEIQGDAADPISTSGVAHVFEIHPITVVGARDVRHTWVPIPGFQYKDADQAFTVYERTRSEISETTDSIRISTEKAGYNYTEFIAELTSDPLALADGTVVYARIFDLNGDLLITKRRLVTAKDTPTDIVLKSLKKGARLKVVGIPRVSLKLVDWRLAHHTGKFAGSLTWNLPYELIVVAVTESDEGLIEHEDTP
jgi:hypothetical protein